MDIPESQDTKVVVVLGGGIGSGKSTVAGLFADAGFDVIVADEVGHGVLEPGSEATADVLATWPDVDMGDGSVDRAMLAGIVFADPVELATLEAITHPAIASIIAARIRESASDEVLVEVPLQHLEVSVDRSHRLVKLAVSAPADVRLARAVARGGDPTDVRRRMDRQPDDASWRSWADHVIDNGGAWLATESNVGAVIDEVRSHA